MFFFSKKSSIKSQPTLTRMIDHSTMLLMIIIGFLILTLALLNLFHKNASATRGYVLRTLENERRELQREQEQVSTKISEAQSLKQLQDDPVVKRMLSVKQPNYIHPDSTFAETPAK